MPVKQLKQIGWLGIVSSVVLYLVGFGYYVWLLQHDSTVTATVYNTTLTKQGEYRFLLDDTSWSKPVAVYVAKEVEQSYPPGSKITFSRNIDVWTLAEDTRLPKYAPEHRYNLLQEIMRWVGPTLRYFSLFFGVLGVVLYGAYLGIRCTVYCNQKMFSEATD